MKVLILLSCVILTISAKNVNKLPSSIKICSLNDPKRDECIRSSMEGFLSALHKKTESIDFIKIEPFEYEPITFKYNVPNLLEGSFLFKDTKSYGLSNVKVLKVKSDFIGNEMELHAVVKFPKLFTTGKYVTDLILANAKFDPKGDFNVSMVDVTAEWMIKGKLENRNGEDFMNIYQFDVLPEAKHMKFAATGLFPNEELSKFTLDFINQNWKFFFNLLLPETRKQWEPIFRNICNKFFAQIPFSRLLI